MRCGAYFPHVETATQSPLLGYQLAFDRSEGLQVDGSLAGSGEAAYFVVLASRERLRTVDPTWVQLPPAPLAFTGGTARRGHHPGPGVGGAGAAAEDVAGGDPGAARPCRGRPGGDPGGTGEEPRRGGGDPGRGRGAGTGGAAPGGAGRAGHQGAPAGGRAAADDRAGHRLPSGSSPPAPPTPRRPGPRSDSRRRRCWRRRSRCAWSVPGARSCSARWTTPGPS